MTIDQKQEHLRGCKVNIHATDISTNVLDTARAGVYNQYEIQNGLPVDMLLKYFDPLDKKSWKLKSTIKNMVQFDYFNLLQDMDDRPEYDIIFCRNVISLFEKETQARVLERMLDLLPEDGFLFLGENEKINGITDSFKEMPDYSGLYILSDGHYKFSKKAAW